MKRSKLFDEPPLARPFVQAYQAPPPKAAPEVAQFYRDKIAGILKRPKSDPKDCWRVLKAKEESGEKLLPVQRSAWRIALGIEHSEAEEEAIAEREAIQSE